MTRRALWSALVAIRHSTRLALCVYLTESPSIDKATDALALAAHVGVGEKGLQEGAESGIL